MKHIGLTGGIGSGKSTVTQMFAELGASIIDADALSRDLLRPGSALLSQVAEVFGHRILSTDGHLDRAELADIIFHDGSARQRLNELVHPEVRRRSAQLLEAAQRNPDFSGVVIEDIPLLVETGQANRFDAVVVVYADQQVRLQRLVELRSMREDDARARIAAQASDEQREAIATWVIDNSGQLGDTREQVLAVWAAIETL